MLSECVENAGNAGVAFPDIGATSPDNAQIVSCYSMDSKGSRSALSWNKRFPQARAPA
jgi:hypothetical protein